MAWPKGKPRPNGAGRKKGTPNKATADKAKAVAASGLTPVDFMVSVMRDKSQPLPVRLDAAKAVANYIHPKLSNVEFKGKMELTEADVDAELARLETEVARLEAEAAGEQEG